MATPATLLLARAAALALVGMLGATLPGLAQNPPAPTEGATETTKLAFKHKAGDVARYRGTVKMDLAVSPEGGGNTGGVGSIPITGTTTYAYTEKVTGTRQGSGTMSMVMDSLTTTMDVFGQKFVTKLLNGKATVSLNGKPVAMDAAARAQAARLARPVVVKRSPLGLVTQVSANNGAFGSAFGNTSPVILQLADLPVKPGDTWETSQRFQPSLAGSGSNRVVIPAIEFKYTHTLRGFAVRNGRRTALIDSTGSGSAVSGDAASMVNQSVMGASRFDLDTGRLASSQYNIILSLTVPAPGAAAQGGPNAVRLDGTIDVTLMQAPVPKKPARKG